MKKPIHSFKSIGALGVLACAALMTACMGQSGVDASADLGVDAVLTGQVAGQEASGETTVVTTHEVDAEGNMGPTVDSVQAEADGSFEIHTRVRGEKALIIRVVRAGQEWKSRFENRVVAGSHYVVGKIDLETSVDAETWLELRKTPEGRAILAADIRAAIEAYADSVGLEAFQSDSVSRHLLVARVVLKAKAHAQARIILVADVIARADSAVRENDSLDVHARLELTPCERAFFLVAAMDPDHPDYAMLRGRLLVNCLDRDTIPPPPAECSEIRARLDGLDSGTSVSLGLRLRLAAYCTTDAPPPQPLNVCERAAVRLTLMDPDRPSAAILKAHFKERCLDEDPSNDDGMDSVMASAEAGAALRISG